MSAGEKLRTCLPCPQQHTPSKSASIFCSWRRRLLCVSNASSWLGVTAHSLMARTNVTTFLLTARNDACHFTSGSGNASTETFVRARKGFSGLLRKSDSRELYTPAPANGTNNVPVIL